MAIMRPGERRALGTASARNGDQPARRGPASAGVAGSDRAVARACMADRNRWTAAAV
jgi:hypothetical protein